MEFVHVKTHRIMVNVRIFQTLYLFYSQLKCLLSGQNACQNSKEVKP